MKKGVPQKCTPTATAPMRKPDFKLAVGHVHEKALIKETKVTVEDARSIQRAVKDSINTPQ